jgi:hypothetical protein
MKKLAVILIALSSFLGASTHAQVAVGVSVGIAPPELPVYEQPPCPYDGYLWTPGYWAWGPDGYYWVPGVWVMPPTIGFLWTPGYWGFVGGHYWWHGGYWGSHIGYYGGVCYGYGYGGHGFYGGRWVGGRFSYNTAAWHVGGGIHNTYVDRTVVVNNGNRASFNGPRGVTAEPNADERAAMNEHHVGATSMQQSHEHSASVSRGQLATVNHGNPTTAARSTVGGARFNAAGHSISHPAVANHAPGANHVGTMNNASHNNAGRVQSQHNAAPNRGAMQRQGGGGRQPARAPQGGHSGGREKGH